MAIIIPCGHWAGGGLTYHILLVLPGLPLRVKEKDAVMQSGPRV